MMTIATAHMESLDVYFFGNEAERARWCAGFEDATGREVVPFEESAGHGFTFICAATTRRPRPVVRLVE